MAQTDRDTAGRDAAAPNRIDIDDEQALRAWATKFDASPDQIKDAVQAVGARADEVELHLKGTRASSNASREAASGPRR